MKISAKATAVALAVALTTPIAAEAHRAWFLPSATVLSGDDPWITVDAAISNDLFYFEHHAMRLDGLQIIGPGGAAVAPENMATGRFRTSFDVHLAKPGTYRIVLDGDSLTARYTVNGERRRWRGTPETLSEIPAGAKDLEIGESQRRLETFVTSGAPDDAALKPTGQGLEMVPLTHPNDLYAGEEARFRLLMDGKPVAGLDVSVIPGGVRYRDSLNEMALTTDADGVFAVTWPRPGYYWVSASVRDAAPSVPQATRRSVSYAATLEVLSP
ncbi:MAG: DUF4198 domain-containing protein [Alphaproteobacteria bacterium]|nr:DUF4198 domain-containing protein [Alphaproteobacteria bacterium]